MENSNCLQRAGRHLWREWLKPTILIAAVILPLKSAIADWNWVPTGSMKPTILEGDLVLVNKLAYDLKVPFTLHRLAQWGNPARGDIVVFFSPEDGTRLVKRVVAGPGDVVSMRNNVVFLNGEPLHYDLLNLPLSDEIYEDKRPIIAQESMERGKHLVMSLPSRRARRSFDPVKVPNGQYFVMGDSRDNSQDSRYIGCVDRKQIVGRSKYVVISFDKNHRYMPRFNRSFSRLDPS